MVKYIQTTSAKAIPYIREYPLVGSLPAFLGDRMKFLLCMAEKNDVYGFHIGLVPMILFNKPEHVQSILVELADDFYKGQLMHKAFTGNGLFISEGEFHRRQRKLMAPAFQPRQIANYVDSIAHYGEQIQQKWNDGAVIDLNQQMIALTMSVIGKVVFDVDVFTETDELGAAWGIVFEYTTQILTSLFTPPLSWPTPRNRRFNKAVQLIENRLQRMIDERRNSPHTRNDLLSILLRAKDEDGSEMSDRQLMDECATLFAAGHETTAAALSWTWYLLCQHPGVYQKVQREVDEALKGRTPTAADLPNLPYCLQVFKETMRLYPPASGILREALHDIEIDGYLVPKGHNVLLSPYTLQR
ncbi:MAG TPA: cytochrome P450, partial [Ktedonobacteraceae bacterium]|nr:cytochrome P450 [Ktedonobacteraceae bacterium]